MKLVGLLVVAAIAATLAGTGAARGAAPDPKAAAYYASRQGTDSLVAAYVFSVHSASAALGKTPSRANAGKVATAADTAANWIDVHLGRLDPVDKAGSLGSAERDLLAGGTGLRDALGTLFDYMRAPTASKSALFLRQYGAAAARWNRAVVVIWRLAQKSSPPVVPVPL